MNRKLVEYIEKYIDLLAKWENNGRTLSYIESVKNNIQQVKDKNFELPDSGISVKL